MSLEWEAIIHHPTHPSTYRLKVEGGWLYRYGAAAMEFVPTKDPQARASGSQPILTPFPMGRRFDPPPAQPKPAKDIIDAEFEEIPKHQVNGSKVITATRVD